MRATPRPHSIAGCFSILLAAALYGALGQAAAETSTNPLPANKVRTYYMWPGCYYAHDEAVYDPISRIYGGASGSTILVVPRPDQDYSDWIFVEGGGMYLNPAYNADTIPAILTGRGQYIRAHRDGTIDSPDEMDKRVLTELLIDVYVRTLWEPLPARYAPFLVGAGWHDGEEGASLDEAGISLAALDLKLRAEGEGYAVSQDPPGGTPLAKNADVVVTFDGSTDWRLGAPAGCLGSPFAIDQADSDNEHVARITANHRDDLQSACWGKGREFCYALPPTACGQAVTVTQQIGYADNITISAWKPTEEGTWEQLYVSNGTRACSSGMEPWLRFTADPKATTLIVVEHRDRELATIHLHVKWGSK